MRKREFRLAGLWLSNRDKLLEKVDSKRTPLATLA
jgi:hypothetical protein